MQCKKSCIDLDKIEATLRQKFTDVKKNVYENHVSALFKSKRDNRVLLVTLKPEGEIISSFMFTNDKTGRSNNEHKRFKTLEGLAKYIEYITRPTEFKAYELHELPSGKFQLCDNVKGMCRLITAEEAKEFMKE